MDNQNNFMYDYAERYGVPVNKGQTRVFGARAETTSITSSGLSFCPPDNAIKLAIQLPFDLDEKCGNWQIVYHGTIEGNAYLIPDR